MARGAICAAFLLISFIASVSMSLASPQNDGGSSLFYKDHPRRSYVHRQLFNARWRKLANRLPGVDVRESSDGKETIDIDLSLGAKQEKADPPKTTEHTTPVKTTAHHTTEKKTTPHHTTEKKTTPHHTTEKKTTPLHTTEKKTTPHHTTEKKTTLHHTTEKKTTPHHTTEKKTTLHHTTEKKTTPHHTTEKKTTHHTTEKKTTAHHHTTEKKTTHHHSTAAPTTTGKPVANSILDILGDMKLTRFISLLEQAGLNGMLNDTGDYTVFAATNDAVDKFENEYKAHHNNSCPSNELVEIIVKNHIIVGMVVNSTEVVSHRGPLASDSNHGSLFVNVVQGAKADVVLLNGRPIVIVDQMGGNGILHVVDGILFPVGDMSALRSINQDPYTTILPGLIDSVKNITDYLANDTIIMTVFVPINEAWSYLPYSYVKKLMTDNMELEKLLLRHVVPADAAAQDQPLFSGALVDGMTLTPAMGKPLQVKVSKDHGVTIEGATVVWPDVTVKNGVIHVIDRVITSN